MLASRPVVGSSKNRIPGEGINSIPILHRFLSPPDTPRINSLPIRVSAQLPVKYIGDIITCGFYYSVIACTQNRVEQVVPIIKLLLLDFKKWGHKLQLIASLSTSTNISSIDTEDLPQREP